MTARALLAFLSFAVAAAFALGAAAGSAITMTANDAAWAIFFVALGLAVAHLPARRP